MLQGGYGAGPRVKFLPDDGGMIRTAYRALGPGLHPSNFFLSVVCAASVIAGGAGAALADYRIRNDYGGFLHKYKLKYAAIRDRGERVIIDGVCNSACTLVLGIVPLNRICVTPRASLGFHTAYFDQSYTFAAPARGVSGASWDGGLNCVVSGGPDHSPALRRA
jgi:hypothetical protein